MERDIVCFYCKHEFEAEEYEPGECPNCKEGYNWYDDYEEESGGSWCILTWDKQERGMFRGRLTEDEEIEKIKQHREAINTPKKSMAFLVKLGTHNPDGTLTPEYGGDEKEARH